MKIGTDTAPLYTIVGVVGDVRQVSLEAVTDAEAVYNTPRSSGASPTTR